MRKEPQSKLAAMLVQRRGEIVQCWLARVQADTHTRGVNATALQNAIPDYLAEIAESLKAKGTSSEQGREAWRRVAREHALTRVRLGFNVGQLVQEFIVLRQVLLEKLREENLGTTAQTEQVADLIDSAIAEAVRAYVESRDYEARRRTAEHVGFLTHQLRNPLTTVRLLVEHLCTNTSFPESFAQPLDSIQRNVNRLEELIRDALQSERLEAGVIEPKLVHMRLDKLLEPSLSAARIAAARKGIDLGVHFDGSTEVIADPRLAATVIDNLLDNAVKYTEKGGIEVRVDDHPGEVFVNVRDSCGGILGVELHKLFEPFTRGRLDKPGTGLGLSIARLAAETQGGTLEARSIAGEGCEFSFAIAKFEPTKMERKG